MPRRLKEVQIPQCSGALAEFLGIHFGDGHIGYEKRYTYRLTYALNLEKDAQFSHFVCCLMSSLFGLDLRVKDCPARNTRTLTSFSKLVCEFLRDRHGVPWNRKTSLQIPDWIAEDDDFFFSFVRGLFDTDGCYFCRNSQGYTYPVIKITTNDAHLAAQLSDGLNARGFRSYINAKGTGRSPPVLDIILNGEKQRRLWAQLVGTSNERNMAVLDGDTEI